MVLLRNSGRSMPTICYRGPHDGPREVRGWVRGFVGSWVRGCVRRSSPRHVVRQYPLWIVCYRFCHRSSVIGMHQRQHRQPDCASGPAVDGPRTASRYICKAGVWGSIPVVSTTCDQRFRPALPDQGRAPRAAALGPPCRSARGEPGRRGTSAGVAFHQAPQRIPDGYCVGPGPRPCDQNSSDHRDLTGTVGTHLP